MTRICKNCGTHLSRYNNDELCFPCQKKKEELARISPYMIRNTRLNPNFLIIMVKSIQLNRFFK